MSVSARAVRGWLGRAWWPLFPAALILIGALIRDRGCFDRLNPLAEIAARPRLAWLLAGVYLATYAWLVAAYLLILLETRRLWPRRADARAACGPLWPKLLAFLALLMLEYCPAVVWMRLAAITGCGLAGS